ncbi:MAG: hypothetical protein PW790_08915 [Parvibaculaceae bacterium]|nr:hypothetical protein [Parvibaculaceae bacterium]
MRNGLYFSVALHVTVILLALVTLPAPKVLPSIPSAVAVELVDIGDVTNFKKSDKPTDKVKAPQKRIVKETPLPVAPQQDQPKPVEQKPEEKPEPAPEPKPEPKPVEKAEEKPEPTPDKVVDAEAEKVKKVEPKKAEEPKPKKAEAKPAKPKPTKDKAKKKDDFDPTQIAALLNKVPDKKEKTQAEESTQAVSDDQTESAFASKLSMTEIDAFRAQMVKCWTVPAGAANAADLVVQIEVNLNKDGTLASPPQLVNSGRLSDPYFRAAADSAMRAIRMCQPYKMPADKYDGWKELELDFNPRDMLGG